MAKTVIDINEEALALAARALGTKSKKDTVNAALQEVGARQRRMEALAALVELDRNGAFDKLREPGFKREVRGEWATDQPPAS